MCRRWVCASRKPTARPDAVRRVALRSLGLARRASRPHTPLTERSAHRHRHRHLMTMCAMYRAPVRVSVPFPSAPPHATARSLTAGRRGAHIVQGRSIAPIHISHSSSQFGRGKRLAACTPRCRTHVCGVWECASNTIEANFTHRQQTSSHPHSQPQRVHRTQAAWRSVWAAPIL